MHHLGAVPVLGVSLAHVALLRLDQAGGPAPGNKSFKLHYFLAEAQRLAVAHVVSFGGAWSNHLHALAALGHERGIATVGIIRGEQQTATLADAQRWGMHIVRVSRQEYRQRNDASYLQQLGERFAPCLYIPEGGATAMGARGCTDIAELILSQAPGFRHIVLPVGTGTTLAGLVAGLDHSYDVVGVSALRNAMDLEQRVGELSHELLRGPLRMRKPNSHARWRILHEHHGGGFARADTALREFMLAFESIHGVQLDPVYTGKMMFAVHQLQARGEWSAANPILAIHTGGLQGRRGYAWLT